MGNFNSCKLLLSDPRVNPIINNDWCFQIACQKGYFELCQILIETGKSDPSVDENFPIRIASLNGHSKIVEFLIKECCDQVDPAAVNNEALRNAVMNNHYSIVCILLLDPRVDHRVDNYFCLRIAAEKGYNEIFRLLLPISDPSIDLNFPIRVAAAKGYVEILKLLLNYSGPVWKEKLDKISTHNIILDQRSILYPVDNIPSSGGLAFVDPSAVDNEAIRKAVMNSQYESVQTLLTDERVDPTCINNACLHIALRNADDNMVALLRNHPRMNSYRLKSKKMLSFVSLMDSIPRIKNPFKAGL
jgi:ankyrin repeat protein